LTPWAPRWPPPGNGGIGTCLAGRGLFRYRAALTRVKQPKVCISQCHLPPNRIQPLTALSSLLEAFDAMVAIVADGAKVPAANRKWEGCFAAADSDVLQSRRAAMTLCIADAPWTRTAFHVRHCQIEH